MNAYEPSEEDQQNARDALRAALHAPRDPCAADQVDAAVAQLNRSERGQQALADFRALLNNGGDSLDMENWKALAVYCNIRATGQHLRFPA